MSSSVSNSTNVKHAPPPPAPPPAKPASTGEEHSSKVNQAAKPVAAPTHDKAASGHIGTKVNTAA